jgi:molecular chaperone DnaK
MKMGEQIYKQEQEAGAAASAEGDADGAASQDDDEEVVDAEFSEVDDDKKG